MRSSVKLQDRVVKTIAALIVCCDRCVISMLRMRRNYKVEAKLVYARHAGMGNGLCEIERKVTHRCARAQWVQYNIAALYIIYIVGS